MITKRTKILLGVLVVVAIGAYAYLYWWSQTPDHGVFDTIPAVQQASEEASGAVIRQRASTGTAPAAPVVNPGTEGSATVPSTSYATFENSEFAFSFAYPDNWKVSQTKTEEENRICINTEDGARDCVVSITLTDVREGASVEKSLDMLEKEFDAGIITESSRTISGVQAKVLKVASYPAGEEEATRAAVFAKGDVIYVIRADRGHEAIFDRVADSFLFRM